MMWPCRRLEELPNINATHLFEELCLQFPGRFTRKQYKTLLRRVISGVKTLVLAAWSLDQKRIDVSAINLAAAAPTLLVTRRCELLDVARSTAYYRPTGVSDEDLALMRLIDEIHLELPFYGSRRLAGELEDRGYPPINRKRVQRLMRQMDLVALYPKRQTSRPGGGHKVYPYLLRGLSIDRPNQVWAADICYLPMAKGFMYLVATMDLHSRFVPRSAHSIDRNAGTKLPIGWYEPTG